MELEEQKSYIAECNQKAEKMFCDIITVLEYAISEANGLGELARSDIYGEAILNVRALLGEASKRSPVDVISDEHGLHLRRYSGEKSVKHVGVRETQRGRRIWEVEVDKVNNEAVVREEDDVLMTIHGTKNNVIEKVAVRAVLAILNERKRTCGMNRHENQEAK